MTDNKPEFGEKTEPKDRLIILGGERLSVTKTVADAYENLLKQKGATRSKNAWWVNLIIFGVIAAIVGPFIVLLWRWAFGL